MVHVKLLKDVAEGGVEYTEGKRDAGGAVLRLRVVKIYGTNVRFTKGAVIPMHEASAEKYIKRGLGYAVKEPPAPAAAKA